MIPIFEALHPGDQMLVIFDQSSAHNAYAPDALNAKRMNVRPSGQQPKMHKTRIPRDDPTIPEKYRGEEQEMVYPDDHPTFPGEPKGLAAVLTERGLWPRLQAAAVGKYPVQRCQMCKASTEKRAKLEAEARARMEAEPDLFGSIGACPCGVTKLTADPLVSTEDAMLGEGEGILDEIVDRQHIFCCLETCAANQKDFLAEKPLIQIEVEKAGHLCLFLPKFHCELNPIEMYWGYAKYRELHGWR